MAKGCCAARQSTGSVYRDYLSATHGFALRRLTVFIIDPALGTEITMTGYKAVHTRQITFSRK